MADHHTPRRRTRHLMRAGSGISLLMTLVQFTQWTQSLPTGKWLAFLLQQRELAAHFLTGAVCAGGVLAALLPVLVAVASAIAPRKTAE